MKKSNKIHFSSFEYQKAAKYRNLYGYSSHINDAYSYFDFKFKPSESKPFIEVQFTRITKPQLAIEDHTNG